VEKPEPNEAPSRLGVVGKYIITPDVWWHLRSLKAPKKDDEIRLADALHGYTKAQEPLYGYAFDGKRFDCGSKLGFLQATVYLGLQHEETGREFKKYLRGLDL
jgi:UTP--glucose-1-phosphate uridylyltransferase